MRPARVGLVVLKQQIDTTTPTGRLVFHILGAIDEFQRELIIEGTREGLDADRARGRTGARTCRARPILVTRLPFRARRFQFFRSRWQRLTGIHRPGLPPSSFTNLGSPVQILITFGRFGSHQMVVLMSKLRWPVLKFYGLGGVSRPW